MSKSNKLLASILAFILISIALWFFVSPLFIDVVVDEDFSFDSKSEMPTRADVMAMSESERLSAMTSIMTKMTAEPDTMVDEQMMPMDEPFIISNGEFKDADKIHKGSGKAVLYQLPDGSHVMRFENFRVTNGPALVVYLAKHSNPTSASDVEEAYFDLGKLKGNAGNQNYVIPAGTDISDFNSVVIWCDLFDVLFSPAALTAPLQ